MKILTISGKAQNGKDYTASLLKDKLEDRGYSVLITHYADLLKYICKQFFGWDGSKDEYGRALLQKVGTEGVRRFNPDYWVDFVIDILHFFPDEWDYVIIPDARFPNEIDKVKSEFSCRTIHVVRPGFTNNLTEEQRQHSSETSLDNYYFDYELVNDGTPEGMAKNIQNLIEILV